MILTKKQPYNWLLIDLDNTLFDFDRAERESLDKLFTHFCKQVTPQMIDTFHQVNRALWQRVEQGDLSVNQVGELRMRQTFEKLGYAVDAEHAAMHYETCLGEADYLYNGAKHLIKDLAAHYQLAAITNGFTKVKKNHLAKSGLNQWFRHRFISMELGVSKPDRLFFEKTLQTINATPDQCLIIGDGLASDIKGGHNSNIDTCWYNPKGADSGDLTPTYQVADYSALSALLLG